MVAGMAGYSWRFIVHLIIFLGPWVWVLIPSSRFPVLIRCEIAIGATGLLTALYRLWQAEVGDAAVWLAVAAVAFGFASMNERSKKE